MQVTARITGIVNGEEVTLDDVFVFSATLGAGNGFRRIASLSLNQIAIVGVNVRVDCTNGVNTADCSVPATTTEAAITSPTTPRNSEHTIHALKWKCVVTACIAAITGPDRPLFSGSLHIYRASHTSETGCPSRHKLIHYYTCHVTVPSINLS